MMEQCYQTDTQTIYQHGLSVCEHLRVLLNYVIQPSELVDWRLPDWLITEPELLLKHLLSWEILEQYTIFHDVGKPWCLTIDEQGKRHFPNHAQVSEQIWLEAGGDLQVGKLIGLDMKIHTLKASQVSEFAAMPEAISLLLTGLAEVHSNAKMFGGIKSTSFKIKFNQIEKRGRAIIKCLKNGSKN